MRHHYGNLFCDSNVVGVSQQQDSINAANELQITPILGSDGGNIIRFNIKNLLNLRSVTRTQ